MGEGTSRRDFLRMGAGSSPRRSQWCSVADGTPVRATTAANSRAAPSASPVLLRPVDATLTPPSWRVR